jgi:hypothetical protein
MVPLVKGAHLPPAPTNRGRRLEASDADLLPGAPRVGDLVKQLLHLQLGSHGLDPRGGRLLELRLQALLRGRRLII